MRAHVVLLLLGAAALLGMAQAHFCGDDNCFEVLKVTRKATKAEIRRSYRKLSQTMHPDKRPGVASAADDFRVIGRAYETLIDDEKRRTYEDFLDNPLKYPEYVKEKYYYAPKTNGAFVFVVLIGVFTLVHWFHMHHQYKLSKDRIRESVDYRRHVARLVKSKEAPSKEAAAAMIDLDNVGIPRPDWHRLFIVRAAYLPVDTARYIAWCANWTIRYRIAKKAKSDEDKLYLIRRNMEKTEAEWDEVPEDEKKLYLEKGLEDPDECAEFLRLRRIELNKQGKLKRKKKHTPVPYSEVEEVSM